MRPHHIIHVSGVAAFLAIASSAVLAYAYPSIEVAVASPAIPELVTTTTVQFVDEVETREAKLGLPMTNAIERVTKKPFGMEIHPETSPVENDRFNGFHVGVDFETTEDEQDIDVPVMAICDGPLIAKRYAGGYGGYALQACQIDGEDVVVLYGHMHLESIEVPLKKELARGDVIGMLGKGHSTETDGVRKHLHLGVHRGSVIDIRGYVQTTTEVDGWLDVMAFLQP